MWNVHTISILVFMNIKQQCGCVGMMEAKLLYVCVCTVCILQQ